MSGEGDEEFAYFLPAGMEDDADDAFGAYEEANAAPPGVPVPAPSPAIEDTSSSAFAGYAPRNLSVNTTWQQQQQQQPPPQQQAALLSVLQRENVRQQQQQQQQQLQYGGGSNSTEALLAALYAQQNTNTAYNGYNPANSPTGGSGGGVFPSSSSGAPAGTDPTSASYNSQQVQFFQQLQLYQQQLLMQQQAQQAAALGASHYTKAPPGLAYGSDGDVPASAASAPPQSDSAAPRRRPLPHSHTNVTIMNRPPTDERDSSSGGGGGVVTQPKTTTVVTASAASSAAGAGQQGTVLAASNWGSGHSSAGGGGAPQASPTSAASASAAAQPRGGAYSAKHVPASVVASTKTEKWPLVTSVKAAPAQGAREEKAAGSGKAGREAGGKQAASGKRSGPPAATIRHIESEAPVPLTATEMAGLNAHLRKAASHLTPEKAPADSPPVPVVTTTTTTVTTVPARRPRHDHHAKLAPGPKPLPQANVFDFLGEAESEEEAEEEEEEDQEKAEDKNGKQNGSADEQAKAADGTATDDDTTPSDAESVEVVSSPSPSPARVSSPPISPTTGLPVPPILRKSGATGGASSPTGAGHARRVSFHQPPSKKQLAAATAAAAGEKKDVSPPSAVTTPPIEEEAASTSASAIAYPVESVTGLRKRGGKGGKKAARAASAQAASTAAAAAAGQKAEEEAEEDDETPEDDAPDVTKVVSPSSSIGGGGGGFAHSLVALFSSFLSRHVASRSRSASARLLSLASYLLGVLLGMAWAVLCVVARLHRAAGAVLHTDHQLAFCFAFLYLFPHLVQHMVWWAPPWAAPCLWYAFLMQVFCSSQGAPWLVALFRVLLPLLFLTEGVSHHTLLLELNGAERLVVAFALASFKTQEYHRPVFLLALAMQILVSLAYGNHVLTQWSLLLVSLMVIHERDPSLPPLLAPPSAPLKGKLASAMAAITSDAAAVDPPSSGATTQPAAAPGWMGSMWSGAFNRRTRAKVQSKAARRTGRF